MTVRRILVASALGAFALAAVTTGAVAGSGQLQHVPVPVLREPERGPEVAVLVPDHPAACTVAERARVPGRITALLEAEDELWVGTFDAGADVLRRDRRLLPDLEGRERFVNALAWDGEGVWVGTQRGAVLYWRGERVRVAAAGVAVSSFAQAGDALYAGTARGLVRIEPDGSAHPVALDGADAALRVTALAATPSHLWLGTPAGAWVAPWKAGGRDLGRARWVPLVFGTPGATTDTVTALAPMGDDVVAGTDDGGLVLLRASGAVAAVRLWPARANDVNPGAMASGGGSVAAGTQGAGLLLAGAADAGAGGPSLAVSRPAAVDGLAVSAVAPARGGWLVGTDDGRVLELQCPAAGPVAGAGPVPTM